MKKLFWVLVVILIIQFLAIDSKAQTAQVLPLKKDKLYHIVYPTSEGIIFVITPPKNDGWAIVNIKKGFSGTGTKSTNGVALNISQAIIIEEFKGVLGGGSVRSNQDAILSDLANLAADAYQYKIRPQSMGGGNGTYAGYQIASSGSWGTSNPNASYEIVTQSATKIKLKATSKEVGDATIDVTYDGNGKVVDGPNSNGY